MTQNTPFPDVSGKKFFLVLLKNQAKKRSKYLKNSVLLHAWPALQMKSNSVGLICFSMVICCRKRFHHLHATFDNWSYDFNYFQLDTEELTVENSINKYFDKLLRLQLDPVWHQLVSIWVFISEVNVVNYGSFNDNFSRLTHQTCVTPA